MYGTSYNESARILTISFTSSGRSYDYYNASLHIWHGLTTASSAGEYFNHFIRDQYAA
ncbi:MAG: KTSC domain-containing protein [Alphaproteobacteria bacterium HGW-Alphaproteobacteria-7]|nr:MAG: KTSC domain-containing protein [Alphaproteobacteria bacterium HGW-Alphaproteobacteria-7]